MRKDINKEVLIKEIINKQKDLNKIPNKRDFKNDYHFKKNFGSWNNALNAAKIKPYYATKFTKESIKAILIEWSKENGKSPTRADISKARKEGLYIPHPKNIEYIFKGKWNEILNYCGLPIVRKYKLNYYSNMTDEEVLYLIKREVDLIGSNSMVEYRKNKSQDTPCINYIYKRFGSWTNTKRMIKELK